MAHYEDLQACDRFGVWDRLLAVGWLEHGKPYARGTVSAAFLARFRELAQNPWQPPRARRRYHRCDLCAGPTWGDGNVFVPAGDRAYVAPNLLPHYVEAHGYAPPGEFIAAVMACPPASEAYEAAMTRLSPQGETEVLDVTAAVRARPGMYFGGQGPSGLEQMLLEVLANSLDQHLAGRVTSIDVDVRNGWVTIEDDGAGFRVDGGPTGLSVLETAFTCPHPTPTLDDHHPHIHVRSIGVGLVAVNALCTRLEVDTVRDGTRWHAAFERGRIVSPLVATGPTARRGTKVRYLADERIFGPVELELPTLEQRFVELGFLFPRLSLRLQGINHQRREGGEARVRVLAPDVVKETVVSSAGTIDEVEVEVSFGWSPSRTSIETYVNYSPTEQGGLHRDGFIRALERTAPTPEALEVLKRGLVAVVHARLLAPRFGGPTKARLLSTEARTAVDGVVSQTMRSVAPWWWDRVLELQRE